MHLYCKITTPQCGVRQGEPLSPFVFILTMNEMSQGLMLLNTSNKLCRSKIGIHHLLFADDMILMCRSNAKQTQVLLDTLNDFFKHARLNINVSFI